MGGHGRCVFMTGGTGYMGQRLITSLLERGHEVRALVRAGSEKKLPAGCTAVPGNALEGESYAEKSLRLTHSCSWWEWHIQALRRELRSDGWIFHPDWERLRRRSRRGFDTSFTLAWRIRRR
jgi:nucleoside-diphosphate-sugar epimerase